MDFAQIIRQVEEEILRLEKVKSLLKDDSFDGGTVRRKKQLSHAQQDGSAAEEYTPLRS